MIVQEIKLRKYPYVSRKGLAERLVKRYFQRKGYYVYRGHLVRGREFSINYEKYENVKNAIDRVEGLMRGKLGLRYDELRFSLKSGLPDYVVLNQNTLFFVEVKLEQESIKDNQKVCLSLLESFGLLVMVLRVKEKIYRQCYDLDFSNKTKTVLVKQEKLWKRYVRRGSIKKNARFKNPVR